MKPKAWEAIRTSSKKVNPSPKSKAMSLVVVWCVALLTLIWWARGNKRAKAKPCHPLTSTVEKLAELYEEVSKKP
jgi:hypothetical protein